MPDDALDDELDPTLPTYYTEESTDFVVETADGEDPDAEPEEWSLEQGFVDATGTVRLYTDESGNPQRIGLARYWRDQIKSVPLGQMFDDVFLQSALMLGRAQVDLPVAEQIDSDEQLSGELLSRMTEKMGELRARMAELESVDEGYSLTQGEQAVGHGADGRIEFVLTIYGTPQAVHFDERWLTEATMAEVTGGVIAAYKDARSRFREPTYIPGERHEIAAQYLTIADTIVAAARQGLEGIRPADDAVMSQYEEELAKQNAPEEMKR